MVWNALLLSSKQNIWKLRLINESAFLSSSLKISEPFLGARSFHGFSPKLTTAKFNILKREYCALRSLFKRSGLSYDYQNDIIRRMFRTSSSASEAKKPPPPPPNSEDGKENKPDDNKNDEDEKMPTLVAKAFLWLLTAYFTVALLSILFPSSSQQELIRYVSWNEFLHHMLAKGEVKEIIVRPDIDIVTIILHEGAVIKGKKMDVNTFHMNIVDVNKFEEKLRAAEQALGVPSGGGIQVVYERDADAAGRLLVSLIIAAIVLSLFSRARVGKSPITMDKFKQLGQAKFTLVDPLTGVGKGVRFSDVAGLKEAKIEVMEVVDYLKRPQHYKNLGAKVPHGVLLLGPPGCGKTLLAKAVATEAEVPFLSMNGSEFVEMIGGLGAARVRDLFKEGRRRTPCIIYIDEIDALGRKRSSGSNAFDGAAGEEEQTLNQLLVEMDGMTSKEGVLLLASTNRAEVLDKALLRPGRFDRHILIDLPGMDERSEIFEYHLKSITLQEPPNKYARRLAYLTPGFSGADIANVVNEAALHAARMLKKQVDVGDLEYAVERVVGGSEKRSSTLSIQEKRVVATHEAGHALTGWLLPDTDVLLKVTIVPRTNLALGFAQYTPSDRKLYTKEQLYGKICMALGGRVAEALEFNKITTGAQNDLEKVTKIAYSMVKEFGMSSQIGLVSFPREDDTNVKPYSGRMANIIDLEAKQIIGNAYKQTEQLLRDNLDKLRLISENLLKKETLNYDDVEKLIGPPLFGKKRLIDPVEFEASLKDLSLPSGDGGSDTSTDKN